MTNLTRPKYLSQENVEGRGSEVSRFSSEIGSGDDAEGLLVRLEVDVVRNEVDVVHLEEKGEQTYT